MLTDGERTDGRTDDPKTQASHRLLLAVVATNVGSSSEVQLLDGHGSSTIQIRRDGDKCYDLCCDDSQQRSQLSAQLQAELIVSYRLKAVCYCLQCVLK